MFLKKAIVTGATGFLGFVLLKELIENGVYVYALCRNGSRRISRLDGLVNVKVIEADLNNLGIIDDINDCDVFYHLAWEGGRNDFDAQYKNVKMSLSCLRFAKQIGCKKFVCTGSQAEYGETKALITEETPLKPVTAYGACKVASFYLLSDLAQQLTIDFVWARVFSVYGPNDSINSLIPQMIKNLLSGFQARMHTNGEHVWNYLYEDDVAKILNILGQDKRIVGTYNVAHCTSQSLKKYIEELRVRVNPDSIVLYGNKKSMVNLNVSIDKMESILGSLNFLMFSHGLEKYLQESRENWL